MAYLAEVSASAVNNLLFATQVTSYHRFTTELPQIDWGIYHHLPSFTHWTYKFIWLRQNLLEQRQRENETTAEAATLLPWAK